MLQKNLLHVLQGADLAGDLLQEQTEEILESSEEDRW